jgi:hypothetical protein
MKAALDTAVHRIDRSHRTPATKAKMAQQRQRAMANAAHINFEINTDDLSCEGYIADSIRTITTFYCAIAISPENCSRLASIRRRPAVKLPVKSFKWLIA